MTGQVELQVRRDYARYYRGYAFSDDQAGYLTEAVAMVRRAGATPAILEYPSYGLRTVNPDAERVFQERMRRLAAASKVHLFDPGAGSVPDGALWADPAHLNIRGAQAFAPELAAVALETDPALGAKASP